MLNVMNSVGTNSRRNRSKIGTAVNKLHQWPSGTVTQTTSLQSPETASRYPFWQPQQFTFTHY